MPAAAVSVVVPTIGRPQQLEACLRSLAACDPPAAEIVVVDQSGGEAIAALCAGHEVRRIASHPAGLGRAMNAGLRAVAYDRVLGTHDDCTVAADWVGAGERLLRRHPGAIVTGRVLPHGDAAHVPSCMTDPHPRDYTGQVRIDKLYPACMGVPRDAVLALGGFDERFLSAAEDNDLCFRWLRAGRSLRYEPAMVVHHHDWRPDAELAELYRRYAHASGVFYGKHLRRAEVRIVPFVLRDLLVGVAGRVAAAAGRRSDRREAILPGVPQGIREGWRAG